MILRLNGTIDDDMLSKLIDFYNEVGKEENKSAIIYFSSNGGSCVSSDAMIDLINYHKDITTLVGYNALFSSAFDLFFNTECKHKFAGGVIGMYHQAETGININEMGRTISDEDKVKKDYVTIYCKDKTNQMMLKLKFVTNIKDKIKKGKDVWFTTLQMENFLALIEQ